MNRKLQRQFSQLEQARNHLLKQLVRYPEVALTQEPGTNQWSVNQILVHLLTSERFTLLYLKKKSQGIRQLNNSGLGAAFRLFLLKISQRLPLRFTAPKLLIQHTPPPVSLLQLTDQWNLTRKELQDFLETFSEDNLRKLVYKHPVAGRFNISQCLAFMYEHFQHHLPQIRKILHKCEIVKDHNAGI